MVKKTYRIPPVGGRRKEDLKLYDVLRIGFLKKHTQCAIYPWLKAIEIHHQFSGGNRDKYLNDVTTWMAVSRKGHNFIHENVALSKELGYLK